jgi:succinoglycan biosynthesis protein ExoA
MMSGDPDDKLNSTELVTIVMPVRNEAEFIERSLRSIFEQDYPHSAIEVVIADGMSVDDTRRLIGNSRMLTDIPITVIDNPERIAPCALNRAISVSNGSVIIRVDGHCEIASDYVTNCVHYLGSGEVDGVGGPIETLAETQKSEAIAITMSSKFGVGGSAFRTIKDREFEVDTVAFPGYKREIFRRLGGFNEELVRNQDDEFNYRIRENGGKILLSPKIRSRYYSRGNFGSLWNQYFQYGYWKVRVFQLHPRQMSLRQFVPAALILSLLVCLVAGFVTKPGFVGFILISSLYLIANLVAAFMSCLRTRLALFPRVSIAFAILHFSYGIGFLTGLIAFHSQWWKKNTADPVNRSATL